MSRVIKVGMAHFDFAKAPDKIRTSGLGSCVGIIIFDEWSKICGLAHIMLPESVMARTNTIQRAKYADTAIADMLTELLKDGASPYRLKAKIAGGAQMFHFGCSNERMHIGPRNVEAVRKILNHYGIKIIGEDVGGNNGRTIEFDPSTSILEIRTVNQGTKEL